MFDSGDIVLIALAALAIVCAWAMVFFKKNIIAAWISTGSLIYLSVFCFKVMYRMEFFGWCYAVIAALAALRVWQLQRLSETKE